MSIQTDNSKVNYRALKEIERLKDRIAELEGREVADDLRNAHMMIVRLCRVARVAGRHEISEKAIDLIRRQGYNPSPLREGEKLKPSAALQEGDKG